MRLWRHCKGRAESESPSQARALLPGRAEGAAGQRPGPRPTLAASCALHGTTHRMPLTTPSWRYCVLTGGNQGTESYSTFPKDTQQGEGGVQTANVAP